MEINTPKFTTIIEQTTHKSQINHSSISETNMEIKTQKVITIIEQTTHIAQVEPITTINMVIHCEPGYYLPMGNNNICKQCSVKGCKNCHGNITHNFCDSCFSKYIPRYINNNLVCSFEFDNNCDYYDYITYECYKCKNEYILYEKRCYAYSFSGTYYTNKNNLQIKLIELDKNYIEKIIIDGEIINASNSVTYFTIPNKGDHQVYYFIINNPNSLYDLFCGCQNLISVKFTNNFKTKNIINLNYMFQYCSSLISVEFSNFDTSNVEQMLHMFCGCHSLTSINLQSFNTSNVKRMEGMFHNCYSLKYLNLGNFNAQKVTSFSYTFYN